MPFTSKPPPSIKTIEELQQYVESELNQLSKSDPQDHLPQRVMNRDLEKPREGALLYADGSNFNPEGLGAGTHQFDGTDWKKLATSTDIHTITDPIAADVVTLQGDVAVLQSDVATLLPLLETINITTSLGVAAGDNGKTIIITGTAMGSVSFAAASGYDNAHISRVMNMSSRRWSVVMDSQPTQWLFPTQEITVVGNGSIWSFTHIPLWNGSFGGQPTDSGPQSVGFFVDPAGDDINNDGLVVGAPLEKIATAIEIAHFHLCCGAFVQLSTGTHTARVGETDVIFRSGPSHGKGSNIIGIIGDGAVGSPNRDNYVVKCPASGSCISCQDFGTTTIKGVKFDTLGNSSTGVVARQFAILDLEDVSFAAFPSGVHIAADNGSIGILASNHPTDPAIKLLGSAVVHMVAGNGSYINYGSFNVDIPVALAFTVFAEASLSGRIGGGPMTFTGAGVAGTTGQRYVTQSGGHIAGQASGSQYPGNVAGISITGDEYA